MTPGQHVVLASDYDRFAAGDEGRIIGFYRRVAGDHAVVSFRGEVGAIPLAVLAEADAPEPRAS